MGFFYWYSLFGMLFCGLCIGLTPKEATITQTVVLAMAAYIFWPLILPMKFYLDWKEAQQ